MSGFGYIYSFYLLVVLLEIWFVFRPEIIAPRKEQHRAYEGAVLGAGPRQHG